MIRILEDARARKYLMAYLIPATIMLTVLSAQVTYPHQDSFFWYILWVFERLAFLPLLACAIYGLAKKGYLFGVAMRYAMGNRIFV